MPKILNLKNQVVRPPGKSSTTTAIEFQKWFEPAQLSKEITRSGLCQYKKVKDFAKTYAIDYRSVEGCEDLSSEEECWKCFPTVNDFFIRRRVGLPTPDGVKHQYQLATGNTRIPRDLEKRVIVSPADNYCVYLPELAIREKLWIKGKSFTVRKLFQTHVPRNYQIVVFRLAPHHYHRYHCPISGKVLGMRYTGTEYFSVAPQIVNSQIDVLTRNVRLNLILEPLDSQKELIYMSMVGASCVGSIQITHPKLLNRITATIPTDTNIVFRNPPSIRVNEELGNFQFGGSTIVMAIPETYTLTQIGEIIAHNTLMRSQPHETEIQVGQVLFLSD